MTCPRQTIGHGREPTVFWGTDSARGRRWARESAVRRLDPDGCVVRHIEADTRGTKTGMGLRPHIGGGVRSAERSGKSSHTLCRGDVLPLDKSLLMGCVALPIMASIDLYWLGKRLWVNSNTKAVGEHYMDITTFDER
jgi:hypothetical protein